MQYKQKCTRCKQNYVLATYRDKFPVCYECHKKEMQGEIADPKMKKLFDIPEDYYKKNSFLRDIKIKYLQFGSLSEKQLEAFKNTVEKLKESEKKLKEDDKLPLKSDKKPKDL